MKLSVFEKLVERIKLMNEKISLSYELGIDLINFVDDYGFISSLLLTEYYGQEGAEWVEWFIYEKGTNPELTAHDADGNPICFDIESLWKEVESLRNSPDFLGVDDKPANEMTVDEKIEYLKSIFGSGEA
jgi:uncharacterized protein YqhQ